MKQKGLTMKQQITNLLTKQGLTIAMITSATLGLAAAILIVSSASEAAEYIAHEQTPTGEYVETAAENDHLYAQPAAIKYESTDEYRRWLDKINQLCQKEHNPLEDKEGFWNCLEEEEQRNPPPEDHLKPQG